MVKAAGSTARTRPCSAPSPPQRSMTHRAARPGLQRIGGQQLGHDLQARACRRSRAAACRAPPCVSLVCAHAQHAAGDRRAQRERLAGRAGAALRPPQRRARLLHLMRRRRGVPRSRRRAPSAPPASASRSVSSLVGDDEALRAPAARCAAASLLACCSATSARSTRACARSTWRLRDLDARAAARAACARRASAAAPASASRRRRRPRPHRPRAASMRASTPGQRRRRRRSGRAAASSRPRRWSSRTAPASTRGQLHLDRPRRERPGQQRRHGQTPASAA